MPDLTPILRSLTEPHMHHRITADATLRSLGLDAIQRAYCLPQRIYEATGKEVPGCVIEQWETVGDVQAWVDELERKAA